MKSPSGIAFVIALIAGAISQSGFVGFITFIIVLLIAAKLPKEF